MLEAIEASDQSYYILDQDVLDSIGNQSDPHEGGRRKSPEAVLDQLYERQQNRYSTSTANSANTVGGMFQIGDDPFFAPEDEGAHAQNKQKSVWTGNILCKFEFSMRD